MAAITITIPDNRVAEFKEAILRKAPVPLDENSQPTMLDFEWVKEIIKQHLISDIRIGKQLLACDQLSVSGDMFQ